MPRLVNAIRELEVYGTWYPWCQVCRDLGWTQPSVVATDDDEYLCADCADDKLAALAARAA